MKVDLTEQVDAARRLKDYMAGTAMMIEFHGGGCNDSGVVVEGETVMLAQVGRSTAIAKIAQTRNGLWLTGYDYSYANGGGAGPASVWSREAYTTRDEALSAVRADMVRRFTEIAKYEGSDMTDKHRAEARKMVIALAIPPSAPAAIKPQQLSLF